MKKIKKIVTAFILSSCILGMIPTPYAATEIESEVENISSEEPTNSSQNELKDIAYWDRTRETARTMTVDASKGVVRFQVYYAGNQMNDIYLVSSTGKEYLLASASYDNNITVIVKQMEDNVKITGLTGTVIYVKGLNKEEIWHVKMDASDIVGDEFVMVQTDVPSSWQYLSTEKNLPVTKYIATILKESSLENILYVTSSSSLQSSTVIGEEEVIIEEENNSYIVFIFIGIIVLVIAGVVFLLLRKKNEEKAIADAYKKRIAEKKKAAERNPEKDLAELEEYYAQFENDYENNVPFKKQPQEIKETKGKELLNESQKETIKKPQKNIPESVKENTPETKTNLSKEKQIPIKPNIETANRSGFF